MTSHPIRRHFKRRDTSSNPRRRTRRILPRIERRIHEETRRPVIEVYPRNSIVPLIFNAAPWDAWMADGLSPWVHMNDNGSGIEYGRGYHPQYGKVMLARLVMGDAATARGVVHHINGNRRDFREENLEVREVPQEAPAPNTY